MAAESDVDFLQGLTRAEIKKKRRKKKSRKLKSLKKSI